MRRLIVLAIMALSLPTAALATSIDFGFGGNLGTTASTSGTAAAGDTFSITSQLLTNNFVAASGTVVVTTGVLTGNCSTGCNFSSGTFEVMNSSSQVIFKGTFKGSLMVSGGVVTISAVQGSAVNFGSQVFANANTGAVSGDFDVNTTPEPSTVGMVGTGLIGLVGLVRRKLRNS